MFSHRFPPHFPALRGLKRIRPLYVHVLGLERICMPSSCKGCLGIKRKQQHKGCRSRCTDGGEAALSMYPLKKMNWPFLAKEALLGLLGLLVTKVSLSCTTLKKYDAYAFLKNYRACLDSSRICLCPRKLFGMYPLQKIQCVCPDSYAHSFLLQNPCCREFVVKNSNSMKSLL